MKFILGTKLGMTQVFREDGTVVPVTKIKAGPCVVTQVRTLEKDGLNAIQVGFGEQKMFRINKAQQGHIKKATGSVEDKTVRFMKEFNLGNQKIDLKPGDIFDLTVFAAGDKVEVEGTSKGKGFQGVVKRHGFAGGPATHGHKDNLRMPGSIGAGGVQRVFKGMRMGGHMGDSKVTVKNLEVVEVHPETGEIYLKGAVPGARGGLLMICTNVGEMKVSAKAENSNNNSEINETK